MRETTTFSWSFAAALALSVACAGGGGGSAGQQCTAGAACTSANPCHAAAIACGTGTPVCTDTGANLVDGTPCGGSAVCAAGACVATRTVVGIPRITFTPDVGAPTTVVAPDPAGSTASAIWVPSVAAAGFTKFTVTAAADGSFSVAGVPVGTYFLETDVAATNTASLLELTGDAPDLTVYTGARPDLVTTTQPLPVALTVANATPFGDFDDVLVMSSQGHATVRPFLGGIPRPIAGATSVSGTFDWAAGSDFLPVGLPNASLGDVTFVSHRLDSQIGAGPTAAEFRRTVDFVGLIDFSLEGVAGPALTVSFPQPAPLPNANLSHDFRNSEFAALASAVHPTAVLDFGLSVGNFASPHSLSYPDWPQDGAIAHLGFVAVTAGVATDVDYGALPYLQFLDPLWKEWRQVIQSYSAPDSVPAGALAGGSAQYLAFEAVAGPPGPVQPLIGPVQTPLINGQDAFVSRTVSEPVTVSWSAPALGAPTSYLVTISLVPLSQADLPAAGQIANVAATVYAGTSFTVPPGLLQAGKTYQATISAVAGPGWDARDRAVFARGTPYYQMDCLTASFSL